MSYSWSFHFFRVFFWTSQFNKFINLTFHEIWSLTDLSDFRFHCRANTTCSRIVVINLFLWRSLSLSLALSRSPSHTLTLSFSLSRSFPAALSHTYLSLSLLPYLSSLSFLSPYLPVSLHLPFFLTLSLSLPLSSKMNCKGLHVIRCQRILVIQQQQHQSFSNSHLDRIVIQVTSCVVCIA